VSCTPTVAEVAWRPAVAHNDPILELTGLRFSGTRVIPGVLFLGRISWLWYGEPILEYSVFYNMTLFGVEPYPGPRGSPGPYRRVPSVDGNRLLVVGLVFLSTKPCRTHSNMQGFNCRGAGCGIQTHSCFRDSPVHLC